MNIFKCRLVLIFLFVFNSAFSQNYRDTVIHDNVYPSLQKARMDKEHYLKAKGAILALEEQFGYEADLKLTLLTYSYYHKDLDFFKEQLEVLVENHGFTVAFMKGMESYYEAILNGELASWFKAMYLKKHFIWLQSNFEKQIDQRKFYDMELKNQTVTALVSKINEIQSLDSVQMAAVDSKLSEVLFSNVSTVYSFCRKNDYYPTAKNFAVVHPFFSNGLYQNFQIKENIERTWLLFEPYIKKSYLRNEMDYAAFRNYDGFTFKYFGYQKYGLVTSEMIPLFRTSNDHSELTAVPVQNAFFAEKAKREFGWK